MPETKMYPDEPAGSFPSPPTTVPDRDDREITLEAAGALSGDLLADVVEMYVRFDPADRAQGIPPTGEERIRSWLEGIGEESVNVVATHDGDVVGHAMLVPDIDDPDGEHEEIADPAGGEWELAIFVVQDYQRAGIGTMLLEHLLGRAIDLGIEWVWLTVERWNHPAIALYERVGFETTGSQSFEQEMAIRLEGDSNS
ncbi:GNAT family N-acetyltransferase [Natrialba sp. INN-245]|uniref:GNAT family N-acetyltransferase n=1 Tax=Natrialba sp. INN-245 TaxID=2690967 RepID=UPI001313A26D|nr:GNAT family N-acetyltransferase [Natrialba sp. INN-245]MWV38555.1 GNAT family N-acetyltransferase [Natrialba sp. INN-245]